MRSLRFFAAPLAFVAWLCLATGADAAVKVRYFKGSPTFVSAMSTSGVEVAVPEGQKGRRIWIAVAAFNFGTEPNSLGYENIRVRTAAGAPANLITYQQLQGQARTRAAWAAFFAGVAAGMNSYSAARYGGSGYIGSVPYYSPVGAQLALDRADAQNTALFATIAQTLDSTLAKLDGSVLRTTTIDPRTSFGGFVVFDLPKGASVRDIVVTVTFGGNTHEIALDDAGGTLQQATAMDVASSAAAAPNLPPPDPLKPAALSSTASAQPPPAAAQVSVPPPATQQAQKCGMIQMDDGVKFVPCQPLRSALR